MWKRKREDDDEEEDKTAVFVDTSIDTHLAVHVSSFISFSLLKQEIVSEHQKCFPQFGKIQIDALTIKREDKYYHVSESMPIRTAFVGANWSLVFAHVAGFPNYGLFRTQPVFQQNFLSNMISCKNVSQQQIPNDLFGNSKNWRTDNNFGATSQINAVPNIISEPCIPVVKKCRFQCDNGVSELKTAVTMNVNLHENGWATSDVVPSKVSETSIVGAIVEKEEKNASCPAVKKCKFQCDNGAVSELKTAVTKNVNLHENGWATSDVVPPKVSETSIVGAMVEKEEKNAGCPAVDHVRGNSSVASDTVKAENARETSKLMSELEGNNMKSDSTLNQESENTGVGSGSKARKRKKTKKQKHDGFKTVHTASLDQVSGIINDVVAAVNLENSTSERESDNIRIGEDRASRKRTDNSVLNLSQKEAHNLGEKVKESEKEIASSTLSGMNGRMPNYENSADDVRASCGSQVKKAKKKKNNDAATNMDNLALGKKSDNVTTGEEGVSLVLTDSAMLHLSQNDPCNLVEKVKESEKDVTSLKGPTMKGMTLSRETSVDNAGAPSESRVKKGRKTKKDDASVNMENLAFKRRSDDVTTVEDGAPLLSTDNAGAPSASRGKKAEKTKKDDASANMENAAFKRGSDDVTIVKDRALLLPTDNAGALSDSQGEKAEKAKDDASVNLENPTFKRGIDDVTIVDDRAPLLPTDSAGALSEFRGRKGKKTKKDDASANMENPAFKRGSDDVTIIEDGAPLLPTDSAGAPSESRGKKAKKTKKDDASVNMENPAFKRRSDNVTVVKDGEPLVPADSPILHFPLNEPQNLAEKAKEIEKNVALLKTPGMKGRTLSHGNSVDSAGTSSGSRMIKAKNTKKDDVSGVTSSHAANLDLVSNIASNVVVAGNNENHSCEKDLNNITTGKEGGLLQQTYGSILGSSQTEVCDFVEKGKESEEDVAPLKLVGMKEIEGSEKTDKKKKSNRAKSSINGNQELPNTREVHDKASSDRNPGWFQPAEVSKSQQNAEFTTRHMTRSQSKVVDRLTNTSINGAKHQRDSQHDEFDETSPKQASGNVGNERNLDKFQRSKMKKKKLDRPSSVETSSKTSNDATVIQKAFPERENDRLLKLVSEQSKVSKEVADTPVLPSDPVNTVARGNGEIKTVLRRGVPCASTNDGSKSSETTDASSGSSGKTIHHAKKKMQKKHDMDHVDFRTPSNKKVGALNASSIKKGWSSDGILLGDLSSESSDDEEVLINGSSSSTRTPSDEQYSSDYSEGESKGVTVTSQPATMRSGRREKTISNASDGKGVNLESLMKSSSRFKKAKQFADSQPEDESEPPEFVPDSQANA